MNIMDLVSEHLMAHLVCVYGRCTVEYHPEQIEVRTPEHDFILQIKFGSRLTAAIGYNEGSKYDRYQYDYPDDMEVYHSMIPTFNLVGHRFFKDPEDPEFLDHVDSTLMEFLDNHEEWSTRRMQQEVRRAASKMSRDEDV